MPRTIEGEPLTKMSGLDFAPKFQRCTVSEVNTVEQQICLSRVPESAEAKTVLRSKPLVPAKMELEEPQPDFKPAFNFPYSEIHVKKEDEMDEGTGEPLNLNRGNDAFAAAVMKEDEQILVKKPDEEELFDNSMDKEDCDLPLPVVPAMELNYYHEKHGYIRRYFMDPITCEMYPVTSSGRIVFPTRRYPD